MKKLLYVLVAAVIISGAAFAGFSGPSAYSQNQGFKGGSLNCSVVPIKDVMNMYDDQITSIRGSIVNRISDDKYLFRDKSGEMVVEIDYKYWNGIEADEKTVLELTGKVDKDYNGVSLDVFMVKKIK